MSRLTFRGFEMCNNHMWKWETVSRTLDFMEKFHMNALIFHQFDLLDQVILPEKYFSEEEMWAYWPIRYCAMGTNGHYINKVIREAKERGIRFYFEVKEIWYPEALLDKHPGLRKKSGHICPTEPFWFQFLEDKVRELTRRFPDMAGVIVSPATRESKVTISANQCHCERCAQTAQEDWYYRYLKAVYEPLKAAGKEMVVRDFAYSTGAQSAVLEATKRCGGDIVMALKNVPHDFWPTFPDNPAIPSYQDREIWIEYDAWGQYCGVGLFPCGLVEDMRRRFANCGKYGCSGMWARTDWELLDESSCLNTFSALNLIAAAMLAYDSEVTDREIYQAWIEYGLMSPLQEESKQRLPVKPTALDAPERLQKFMNASWSVLEKTLYVRGHVFNYSSRFQHAYRSIYNVMNVYHQKIQWDPDSAKDIEPTEENLEIIFDEKRQAMTEAKQLEAILDMDTLGVPDELAHDLREILDLCQYYAEGFYHMAKVYFGMKKALENREAGDLERVIRANEELADFCDRLQDRLRDTSYPFYVYWAMDVDELRSLHRDIEDMVQKYETT